MKILICVDKFSGGAGNIAQLLSMHFSKKGINVVFFVDDISTPSRYDLSGIKVIKRFEKKGSIIENIISTSKQIKNEKPDLIISFLTSINREVLISQFFNKIPIIVSERSNPYQIPNSFLGKIIRDIAYLRADLVTVQFDCFKGFSKFLNAKKYVTTPNPILNPKIDYKRDFENKRPITFVTFASQNPCKRIDLMIKLFKKINTSYNNTELHIYGSIINNHKIRNLIKTFKLENNVVLHGHINNVHNELFKHDIYLMTSSREGFPNSLCEAMALGKPSVSFKCHDGLKELITDGENGFLIEGDNEENFITAANNLVKDAKLREKIGSKAKLSIKRFDENSIYTIWDHLINKISKDNL
jgi:glycosyltransferase involved in cell wall biosynthesis